MMSQPCSPPQTAKLPQLAKQLGIADHYYDIDGNYFQIPETTLSYFIDLIQDSSHHDAHIAAVYCFQAQQPLNVDLPLAINAYRLIDENDQILQVKTLASPEQSLALAPLSEGYYTLVTTAAQATYCYRLIVAPSTCYQPKELQHRQLTGLNCQLYSLRPENTDRQANNAWGIADFSDLLDAVDQAHQYGMDFIGINPLHALYPLRPDWASPYSPSSRQWKNWLYIAIDWLPEFTKSPEAQTWLATNREQLAQLSAEPLVNYNRVAKLKHQALSIAFMALESTQDPTLIARRQALDTFVIESGESLLLNSTFHAINQHFTLANRTEQSLGYLDWAAPFQDYQHPYVKQFQQDHVATIRFYHYLQWLVDSQLAQIKQHCQQRGLAIGLYGDLAIGCAKGSADNWANPSLYWTSVTIGAPPDPLGPIGQNWQLPPINPSTLQQQGYQPFIDIVRANMKHVGALRIDHVMGLYRLWLIPDDKGATEGTYISYPFEHLMAILAIESHRAQCLVIGEDLGTVPNIVRQTLDDYNVLSYAVLYFDDLTKTYMTNPTLQSTLGVIGTHDLPPLSGWWHCQDLHLLGKLGILDPSTLNSQYQQRLITKQTLLETLKSQGFLPEDYEIDAMTMAMHPRLCAAIHNYYYASGKCLFGIQPENLIATETAFNVPGTTHEVPNWRRKLPLSLSDILATADTDHLLDFIGEDHD